MRCKIPRMHFARDNGEVNVSVISRRLFPFEQICKCTVTQPALDNSMRTTVINLCKHRDTGVDKGRRSISVSDYAFSR